MTLVKSKRAKRGRKSDKKRHYVNPKEFEAQIIHYYDTGEMVDELGKAIVNIATKLSNAPNFINYTYKDEMIGDAIVNMFLALKNKKFNPEKGNPYSYYTTIAYNAYVNRIKKEKKMKETLKKHQTAVYNTLTNTNYIPDTHKSESNEIYDEENTF